MSDEIVNKVARSSLLNLDLEELYTPGERVIFDLKNQLFQGLILKEKDFREFVNLNDWSVFEKKHVAITCSAEAIIPTWAYMLLASTLQPYANTVVFGTLEDLEVNLFAKALESLDWTKYRGAKVVIKGCSKITVPLTAYVEVTNRLRPIASSIMYGEPCSTVPIFKLLKKA